MAKPILVTGASSSIGKFLLPRLLAGDHEVLAVSRHVRQAGAKLRWHAGDLTDPEFALPGQDMDALIHLAPLWLLPHWLERVAQDGKIGQLIAFGSTSRWSKMESASPAEREIAQALARAEEQVIAWAEKHGVAWTILRPTLIYGAAMDRNVCRLAAWIRKWRLFPILGQGVGRRQPVHADDLAAACVLLLGQSRAAGRSYDLSGGDTISYHEMVGRIFDALQLPRRIVSVPERLAIPVLAMLSRLRGLPGVDPEAIRRMAADLCFDHGPASEDFGYQPRPFYPRPAELGIPNANRLG